MMSICRPTCHRDPWLMQWRKISSELKQGDKVLVSQDGGQYVYVVDSIDGSSVVLDDQLSTDGGNHTAGTGKYRAESHARGTGDRLCIHGTPEAPKGLIIVGLVVVFVIILFILAEVWKKDDDEDEEEDEDDEEDESEEEPGRRTCSDVQTATEKSQKSR